MKINKKIINKIEGEATLKIVGEKRVKKAYIEFNHYHGIEKYLINRPFMDALVINPRICGICGHSHLYATAKVIEKVFNVKLTNKAKIIREITSFLEIIENHIKWFYITLFPTQIKDKKYIFKAVKFSSEISKAIAILAGQFPHNSYMIPGGVTCDITYIELMKLKDLIKKIRDDYQEEIMDMNLNSKDLELFFENIPKDIGKSLNKFLVLGESSFFRCNGDIDFVKEKKTSSFLKNALYKDEFYEVGPLARTIINKNEKILSVYKKYQDSIYTRIIARLYEGLILLNNVLELIEKIDLCEDSYIKPKVSNGKAKVSIEAPRGSLIHEIEITDEKITKYNIIVPTQFNLSSSKTKNSPAQAALMNEDIKYIDTIFKCFDVCAVCMSH